MNSFEAREIVNCDWLRGAQMSSIAWQSKYCFCSRDITKIIRRFYKASTGIIRLMYRLKL